jgi:hypothetical protein
VTWLYGEFVLDLEPQGPLPPQVYWRRRGLALGIAALAIALVAGISFALFGGSGSAKNAANETTQTPQPENKTPVVESAESSAAPTPTPTAAVEPPPVLQAGDDCPDSTLAVKGITNAPQYVIGDQPKFTMVVTNIGLVACKRDVGAAAGRQVVRILRGTKPGSIAPEVISRPQIQLNLVAAKKQGVSLSESLLKNSTVIVKP